MKRIAITIAALAFSTASLAEMNPDNHGDVLMDLDKKAEQTVTQAKPAKRDTRATDNDFAVGDNETIFDFDIISGGGGE